MDARNNSARTRWIAAGGCLLATLSSRAADLPSTDPWRSWWAFLLYTVGFLLVLAVVIWQRQRRHALSRLVHRVQSVGKQRLNLALMGSGDGLWDWNIETGEIFRAHVAQMLGYEESELPRGLEFRDRLIHPEDREMLERRIREHLQGDTERLEVEYRMLHKDGGWRWVLDRGVVVERDTDGMPLRMAGTFKDMTRSKQVEIKLRLWGTVFESITEGVMITDTRHRILAVNPMFCRMSGFERRELVGRPTSILASKHHDRTFYRGLRHALVREGCWRGEVRQSRRDGRDFVAAVDLNQVLDDAGQVSHYVAVVSDITQRKKSEEELRYLANYDVLTGLPNRCYFQESLERELDRAKRREAPLALVFGDLDEFKRINDTLGHGVGDQLLKKAARRLLGSVRRGDIVARLGGDEFTVLLSDIASREDILLVADRILAAFTLPFELEDREAHVSTSLGIALFPDHGLDVETLLKHADLAMYAAKAEGRNRYCFYTEELSIPVLESLWAAR